MKTWIMVAIVVSLLVIAGTAAYVSATAENQISGQAEIKSCSSCGNSCTAENNCELGTCGAVSGVGTCNCGK